MENDKFIEFAIKDLNGEISPDDKASLEKLLGNPRYKEQYEEIRMKWESYSADGNSVSFDKGEGWDILIKKIKKYEPEFDGRKEKYKTSILLKIAASIVFLIISSGILLLSGIFDKKGNSINWIEKSAMRGEKLIITLPDSSRITLNAESKLKYPAGFPGNNREVFLEGEAFFEVKHDSSKPFLARAQGVITKVLGTVFNVSAYSEENNVNVSLVSGKIRVSSENSPDGIMLQPMQKLQFSKNDETSIVAEFDLQKETGWKNNIYIFDNEPLEKVLKQLERNYGVKMELEDNSSKNKKIKANFKNESLATVIEVIKKSMQLKAKIEKKDNQINKVVFYKK